MLVTVLLESVAIQEATFSNYAKHRGRRKCITRLSENVIVPNISWKELIVQGRHGRDDKYELSDSRSEPLSNHLKG